MELQDIPACLSRFKMLTPIRVVWGDMDSMRHVNNTRYFYYCETARLDFFQKLDEKLDMGDEHSRQAGITLAETACRFKVSLTYPDSVTIGSAVDSIESTQFTIIHHIYSEKLNCIAAEASARMVMFDFAKGKRMNIPDDYLAVLRAHRLAD